jgi:hypothetical protein
MELRAHDRAVEHRPGERKTECGPVKIFYMPLAADYKRR